MSIWVFIILIYVVLFYHFLSFLKVVLKSYLTVLIYFVGISHDHIVDTGVILFFPYTGFDCDFSLLLICNKVKVSCLSSPFCEVSINTAMHLLESPGSLSQPYIYLNFFFFSFLIIPDLFWGLHFWELHLPVGLGARRELQPFSFMSWQGPEAGIPSALRADPRHWTLGYSVQTPSSFRRWPVSFPVNPCLLRRWALGCRILPAPLTDAARIL